MAQLQIANRQSPIANYQLTRLPIGISLATHDGINPQQRRH